MDVFARSWVMMKENACKDCLHRKLLPAEAYNRIASCLDTTLVRQQTLIALLEDPDSDTLAKADELAMTISSELQACRDVALDRSYAAAVDAYAAEVSDRPAPYSEAQELTELLARAKTLREAHKPTKARDIVEDVLRRARGIEDAELVVAALLERCECRLDQGEYQGAEQDAREAVRIARVRGYGPTTARALTEYGFALMRAGQAREALKIEIEAEEASRRAWNGRGVEYARAAHYLGMAYTENNRYDDSLDWYQKALAMRIKYLGAVHPSIATTMNNIGATYIQKGAYDEALVWLQKALTIYTKSLGAEHPRSASTMHNIGSAYLGKGANDESLGWYGKALAVFKETLGVEHPSTAQTMLYIGTAYAEKGDNDEALSWYRTALAINEKTLGTEHPSTAAAMYHMGVAYQSKGAQYEALGWYRKALAIQEKTLGAEHSSTSATRDAIQNALSQLR